MKIKKNEIITFQPITVIFESKDEVDTILNFAKIYSDCGSLNMKHHLIIREFIDGLLKI